MQSQIKRPRDAAIPSHWVNDLAPTRRRTASHPSGPSVGWAIALLILFASSISIANEQIVIEGRLLSSPPVDPTLDIIRWLQDETVLVGAEADWVVERVATIGLEEIAHTIWWRASPDTLKVEHTPAALTHPSRLVVQIADLDGFDIRLVVVAERQSIDERLYSSQNGWVRVNSIQEGSAIDLDFEIVEASGSFRGRIRVHPELASPDATGDEEGSAPYLPLEDQEIATAQVAEIRTRFIPLLLVDGPSSYSGLSFSDLPTVSEAEARQQLADDRAHLQTSAQPSASEYTNSTDAPLNQEAPFPKQVDANPDKKPFAGKALSATPSPTAAETTATPTTTPPAQTRSYTGARTLPSPKAKQVGQLQPAPQAAHAFPPIASPPAPEWPHDDAAARPAVAPSTPPTMEIRERVSHSPLPGEIASVHRRNLQRLPDNRVREAIDTQKVRTRSSPVETLVLFTDKLTRVYRPPNLPRDEQSTQSFALPKSEQVGWLGHALDRLKSLAIQFEYWWRGSPA